MSGFHEGLAESGGVVTLAAAAVQQGGGWAVRQQADGQSGEGLPKGGVVAPVQEGGAGGHHGLVIAGILRVFLVGGQQVGIALSGDVKAVALGTGIAVLPAEKRSLAQGTAE